MRPRNLFLAFVLSTLCIVTSAQDLRPSVQTSDQRRVERLAGLAKVWGAVKLFHPYLAYREIDWDKALIDTIPHVNAAKTPQDYSVAINLMLEYLSDKNTYASVAGAAKAIEPPASTEREFLRLEHGVFFIEPALAASSFEKSPDGYYAALQKTGPLLGQAKSIVIDGRCQRAGRSETFDDIFDLFLRQELSQVLDDTVTLGSHRSRMHNGLTPQTGATTGGYYSALVNTSPETLAGRNKNKILPTVFIYDEQTPVSATLISGLQAANKMLFVLEGESNVDIGVPAYEIKLSDGVVVKMRTAELVNPDGSVGLQPDVVVSKKEGEDAAMKEALKIAAGERPASTRKTSTSANAPQIASKEKAYAEMEFPGPEYRLLALFRFWTAINYLYPYKDLIGSDWNEILPRYIPKFEADKDALEYQTTVREMVTEIHDSHGFVRGTTKIDEKLGNFVIPVMTAYINGRSVVTNLLDDKTGVKVGDVVVAIDGEPVERRREFLARIQATSSPQAFNAKLTSFHMMRLAQPGPAKLTLKGADGRVREVQVTQLFSIRDPKTDELFHRSTPVIQVLPSGFGYVDLDRLPLADVNKMFETIKNTPATIFDMRGYPNGTAPEIAPRLTTKKNVIGALFSRPIVEATGLGIGWLGNPTYTFSQPLPEPKGDIYKGRVVMLIDGNAGSQAEHLCLAFESAADVTFIGTPTAGVNGDITNIVVPGNIVIYFSGQSVRHADGRQLQRLGVQPTVKVEPTIRGTREGRDEILEAAVRFLRSGTVASTGKSKRRYLFNSRVIGAREIRYIAHDIPDSYSSL
jgi:C-terminal processing protease CtpA/Prc